VEVEVHGEERSQEVGGAGEEKIKEDARVAGLGASEVLYEEQAKDDGTAVHHVDSDLQLQRCVAVHEGEVHR
jgi:hypothetical protein